MENKFPKACRLRKSWEFNRVWKMGCKLHTPHFILLSIENSGSCSRLGLTVSRKVGNAVQRNRVKRLLREFFRNHQQLFVKSVDYSVIAKYGAAELTAQQIFSEMERALRKLEI